MDPRDHLYFELKRAQIPGQCTFCKSPLPKRRRVWCSDECRDEADGLSWAMISARHLRRTHRHCEVCGRYDFDAVVHHKIPISEEEGNSRDENLVVLCRRCHGSAHMRLQTHQKSRREKKLFMAQDPGNARIEDFTET